MPKPKIVKGPAEGSERERYLATHQKGFVGVKLPPGAVEDLKYFETQATRGRVIKLEALLSWVKDKHDISIGPTKLHTLASAAGVQPWWSRKR